MTPSGKCALITGASSGIGRELATLFARDGYDLTLVARDRAMLARIGDELTRVHGVAVDVIAQDLSHPNAAAEVYRELKRRSIKIDVLVNNAGFGTYGPFVDSDAATESEMLQLNIVALTKLTRLFLEDMLAKREGRILNVASTAAFQPGPLMAVYYASKAYVLSFSEALANELRDSGVTVSTLCPGPTQIATHLLGAVPHGTCVECFPDPERDPLWAHMYVNRPPIADGIMTIPDEPGFGIHLDWQMVEKYKLG
jgi:short-subunit dehydrogenase